MIPAGAFLSSLLPSAVVEAIVAVYNRKHQSPLEINFVLIACLNCGQRHVRLSNFKICIVNSHKERDYYSVHSVTVSYELHSFSASRFG